MDREKNNTVNSKQQANKWVSYFLLLPQASEEKQGLQVCEALHCLLHLNKHFSFTGI